MHGSELDPIGVGMKRILDLGGADAHIVVVIGAPKRVYAVRRSGTLAVASRGRTPQRRLQRDRSALDAGRRCRS